MKSYIGWISFEANEYVTDYRERPDYIPAPRPAVDQHIGLLEIALHLSEVCVRPSAGMIFTARRYA